MIAGCFWRQGRVDGTFGRAIGVSLMLSWVLEADARKKTSELGVHYGFCLGVSSLALLCAL